MTIENGFAGQESDVNRACSAFGLDTVNYRAFPDTGPVPAPPPAVTFPVPPELPPQPPFLAAAATLGPLIDPRLSNPQPQQPPHYIPQTAPAPNAGPFGMDFPLLAQALPAGANIPTAMPMAAFSKARMPLRSISSNEHGFTQNRSINATVFGTAFAAAFNAAFGTQAQATAPAAAPDLSSNFMPSQT